LLVLLPASFLVLDPCSMLVSNSLASPRPGAHQQSYPRSGQSSRAY
jgi:hypothetical protein